MIGLILPRDLAYLLVSGQRLVVNAIDKPPQHAVGQRIAVVAEGDPALFLWTEYKFESAAMGDPNAYGNWVSAPRAKGKRGKYGPGKFRRDGTFAPEANLPKLQWVSLPRGPVGSAELEGFVKVERQDKELRNGKLQVRYVPVVQYRPKLKRPFRKLPEARPPYSWVFRAPRVERIYRVEERLCPS